MGTPQLPDLHLQGAKAPSDAEPRAPDPARTAGSLMGLMLKELLTPKKAKESATAI